MILKFKRFLCFLLTLCMVLAMLPVMTMPVYGEENQGEVIQKRQVGDLEDLKKWLADDSANFHLKLVYDIQDSFHESGYWNDASLLDRQQTIIVKGQKTIDLNGHTLDFHNRTSALAESINLYALIVTENSTLRVVDSDPAGKGSIVRTSKEAIYPSVASRSLGYENIFKVNEGGTLIIDGGNFVAGNESKHWFTGVERINNKFAGTPAARYTGYAYLKHNGNVIGNYGTVYINGGNLTTIGGIAILKHSYQARTIINGGKFESYGQSGNGSAFVAFSGVAGVAWEDRREVFKENVKINGGTFETFKRRYFYYVPYPYMDSHVDDYQGILRLYPECINSNAAAYTYDKKSKTYNELVAMDNELYEGKKKLEVFPGGPSNLEITGPTVIYTEDINNNKTNNPTTLKASADSYFGDVGRDNNFFYYWMISGPDGNLVKEIKPQGTSAHKEINLANILRDKEMTTPGLYEVYVLAYESLTGNFEDAKASSTTLASHYVELKDEERPQLEIQVPTELYFTSGKPASQNIFLSESGASLWPQGELPANISIEDRDGYYTLKYDGTPVSENVTNSGVHLMAKSEESKISFDAQKYIFTNIYKEPEVSVIPSSEEVVIINKEYTKDKPVVELTASAGPHSTFEWTVNGLPPGLNYITGSGGKCYIVGKEISTTGKRDFRVGVQVRDKKTYTLSDIYELNLILVEKPKLEDLLIETSQGNNVSKQIPYNTKIDEWEITEGTLPAGLELSANGSIIGTVGSNVEVGTYTVKVEAKNAAGSDSADVTITVGSINNTKITNSYFEYLFLEAVVGQDFSYQMKGEPDKGEWKISKNYNGDWLEIDKDTGLLSGTPKTEHSSYSDEENYQGSSYTKPSTSYAQIDYVKDGTGVVSPPFVIIKVYDKITTPSSITIENLDNVRVDIFDMWKIETNGSPIGKITLVGDVKEVLPGLSLTLIGDTYYLAGTAKIETAGEDYTFTLRSTNMGGHFDKKFTIKPKLVSQMPAPAIDIPGGPIADNTDVVLTVTPPSGYEGMYYKLECYVESNGVRTDESKFGVNGEQTLTITVNPGDVVNAKASPYLAGGYDGDLLRPSEMAAWEFTAKATGENAPISKPEILTTNLPDGKVGKSYNFYLDAKNGVNSWEAQGLPEGLTIDRYMGIISGTPTENGIFNIKLIAQNGAGTDTEEVTLKIIEGLVITTEKLEDGIVNKSYTETTLTASGGTPGSTTWSVLSGLPDDLNLDKNTGIISGTPTESGSSMVLIQAMNGGDQDIKSFNLNIFGPPKITTDSLPKGGIGTDYTTYLELEEDYDTDDVKWSISGNLPNGLTLVEKNKYELIEGENQLTEIGGEISGKPTNVGDFTFEITATNVYGSNSKEFTVEILANVVTGIEVVTPPTKTSYREGETFNPAGMVVEAIWTNGDKTPINNSNLSWYDVELITDMDYIEIGYIDDLTGLMHKATSPITVKARTSSGGSGGAISYTLNFETNGGGKLDAISKVSGTEISLNPYKPVRQGYTFEGWYGDKALTLKLTNLKLTADTTIYAKWSDKTSDLDELPFIDVLKSDWFYDNVAYVYYKGLMVGTSDKTFSPHASTNRGMIVTILHRLEGLPSAKGDNPFDDVEAGKWYTDAVIWAAEKGIVRGYGNGKFGPEDAITREQMAVILMNYAKFKAYDVSMDTDLTNYQDAESISSWAKEAMSWANALGLIQGDGIGLNPQASAERCQVAAILQRFIENTAK